MSDDIKTALDTREYLIKEIKKQLVGPGMGNYENYSQKGYEEKYEVLNKSPRNIYTAGILFPQGEISSNNSDEDKYENENI